MWYEKQGIYRPFHWLFCLYLLLITACTTAPRQFAAPAAQHYAKAEIPGFRNIRYWGDKPAPYLDETMIRLRKALDINPSLGKRIDILALSGGAEDGAYGAGFLKGWSERGDRPEFFMVTGISTGAIIAPFAFLGPDYDDVIERFFTETSQDDIFEFTPVSAVFGGNAIGDTAPLLRIIREEVDEEFVSAIARESRRGRILQVGTTNLDAQRPVVWEIGRIAESGHPDAARLIGDIILASASIPGVFPPVFTDVVIDHKRYQEVHVDGGVTNQMFVYPRGLKVREIEKKLGVYPEKNFWLIRNTKVDPVYQPVKLDAGNIAGRAIATLIKYQGRGDLINISSIAKRDGFNVYLTNVPADFNIPLNELFDVIYMRALYQRGYETALSEKPWQVHVDGLLVE
jgi:hypothetical protein